MVNDESNHALRLGVIGFSEGNGHPFSWSAIFNGFDKTAMEECGFPAIPQYLSEQSWPDAQIPNCKVVGVWTQDKALSNKIAKSAFIPHVFEHPKDMLGKIDALLLARDDAENHRSLASVFLAAGVPVYVDKPIALNSTALETLYDLCAFDWQIFTCSALRYAEELKLHDDDLSNLGEIREIHGMVPNSWNKYAIHVIEPILNIIPSNSIMVSNVAKHSANGVTNLDTEWSCGIKTRIFAMGYEVKCPIEINVYGSLGQTELVFHDSFNAFRAALSDFINGIKLSTQMIKRSDTRRAIHLLEQGVQKT